MNHHVPPRLQREHVHCPITALAFFRPPGGGGSGSRPLYVLSGEDTHLKIYDAETQQLRASVRVFAAQPIQGISAPAATTGEEEAGPSSSSSSSGGGVLIWGGPLVTVLPVSLLAGLLHDGEVGRSSCAAAEHTVPEGQVLRAPDWVYHGAVATHQPGLAAIVTAHNEVIPLLLRTGGPAGGGGGWGFGRLRSPPSRPILYSAQVRWTSDREVLVAAGTVFGEIIVWKCRIAGGGGGDADDDDDGEEEEAAVEVLHVFTGHEGSIFGVDFSPEVVIDPRTREVSRLLVSCSDDRTIRVWNVSVAGSTGGKSLADSAFTEARETGFGENFSATELEAVASHPSTKPLAVAMGHVSRIWSVRFSPQSIDRASSEGPVGSLALYSFGEDGTAQKWRLEFHDKSGIRPPGADDTVLAAGLAHEATFHNHDGKHIWSSALHSAAPSSPEKELLATGGSDGKIQLVEESLTRLRKGAVPLLQEFEPSTLSSKPSVDQNNLDTHQLADSDSVESEPLHMYGFPSATSVVATTASGRILAGSLGTAGVSWKECPVPKPIRDDLRKYQTVRSAGLDTTLIGSPSGQVYIYGNDNIRPVTKLPRKIADIFVLPLEDFRGLGLWETVSGQVATVVTTMGSSEVRLLLLDPAAEEVVLQETSIELEKGFIPTAAGICQDLIIFGSRIGSLSLHRLDQSGEGFKRVAHASRPGSKDSVSSIIPLPAKPGLPCPYFLTTSRDGRYRIYETIRQTCGSDDALIISLRHEAVPPLGPIIESGFFTTTTADPGSKPHLILCGFRSREFVVWNETTQQELANVECGGGHRAFTFHVDPRSPDRLSFIWTKASRTCVYTQDGVSKRSLKAGGHGREIKAAGAAAKRGLLATGAEDTNIRIWRTNGHSRAGGGSRPGLSCLAVVERHTNGIQCLRWTGENYLVSSSGGEELFIWRVAQLEHSTYEGIAVLCEGVYPDKTRDGDLRIMSFDVQTMHPAHKGEDKGGEVLCLSLVLSNSTLKTYRYSKDEGFTLLAQGHYTGACLMQIRHLKVQPESDGPWDLHVLTASTDGHLALWKAKEVTTAPGQTAAAEYELVEAQRLHQSSIKAIDLKELARPGTYPASSHVVLTGGDDNAIGYVRLDWTADTGFRITSRSLVSGAHAAAITGLCITEVVEAGGAQDGDLCRVRLCTSSNDQRVRSWVAAVGDGGALGKVSLVGDLYSGVADPGDLEQLGEGRVVVAGVGMELWSV